MKSITNVGDNDLITVFQMDEYFNPENSDTCYENV